MKTLLDIQLSQQLWKALQESQKRLSAEFAIDRFILFGSIVRGEADEESDVDLLIVLKDPPTHQVRNAISRLILNINLEYDTNLSGLVVDQKAWDEGLLTVLPIHEAIEAEGLRL